MNALFVIAAEVQSFCDRRGWRSCVIGGLAVQRWGEPRQTRDVDLTILTGLGGEADFVDALLETFPPRFPEARSFALDRRVLLVACQGTPVDISLGGLPYEERVIARSSSFDVGDGVAFMTCSAEDLVVLKAFAGRPQDWIDVEGIVVRQSADLNRTLVREELIPLLDLKEEPEAAEQLQRIFKKHRAI